MTKKKVRVKAAYLANAMILVFAVIVALPGISSFVPLSVPEVTVAVDPFRETETEVPETAETPKQVTDQVLAAFDESQEIVYPSPESNYIQTSLTGLSLSSQETTPEIIAIQAYQEAKAEEERLRAEALERERKMYEYYAPYAEKGITLPFDDLYPNDYRPSEEEYQMLAWVVQHEAGPSSFQEEVMVCEAIFNRLFSKKFPNDLISVLTAKNQFNGLKGYFDSVDFQPSETVRNAIAYVLSGKAPDLIKGAVYFCNPDIAYHMDWFNTLDMTVEIPHYRFYK